MGTRGPGTPDSAYGMDDTLSGRAGRVSVRMKGLAVGYTLIRNVAAHVLTGCGYVLGCSNWQRGRLRSFTCSCPADSGLRSGFSTQINGMSESSIVACTALAIFSVLYRAVVCPDAFSAGAEPYVHLHM